MLTPMSSEISRMLLSGESGATLLDLAKVTVGAVLACTVLSPIGGLGAAIGIVAASALLAGVSLPTNTSVMISSAGNPPLANIPLPPALKAMGPQTQKIPLRLSGTTTLRHPLFKSPPLPLHPPPPPR